MWRKQQGGAGGADQHVGMGPFTALPLIGAMRGRAEKGFCSRMGGACAEEGQTEV